MGNGFDLPSDIADLLFPARPRLVVVTRRAWMTPYFQLEESALGILLETARAHGEALTLWLRQLGLFQKALTHAYNPPGVDRETWQSVGFRLDFIGLAAANSKLALDAMLAGS